MPQRPAGSHGAAAMGSTQDVRGGGTMPRDTADARATEPVTADHVRALTTLTDRSVLVRDRDTGRLLVITPDAAAAGALCGRLAVLCTRADLLDAGLAESYRAGRLTGPVVDVCTTEAAAINAAEATRYAPAEGADAPRKPSRSTSSSRVPDRPARGTAPRR